MASSDNDENFSFALLDSGIEWETLEDGNSEIEQGMMFGCV